MTVRDYLSSDYMTVVLRTFWPPLVCLAYCPRTTVAAQKHNSSQVDIRRALQKFERSANHFDVQHFLGTCIPPQNGASLIVVEIMVMKPTDR